MDNEELVVKLLNVATDGDIDTVKQLITSGVNINAKSTDGSNWTALHKAVLFRQTEVVDYLLSTGCDVNMLGDSGYTPLHLACRWGHDTIVHKLVQYGGDIHCKNDKGWKSVHLAACGNHLGIVKYLHSQGANLHDRTNEGYTVSVIASMNGHQQVIAYVVDDIKRTSQGDSVGIVFDTSKETYQHQRQTVKDSNLMGTSDRKCVGEMKRPLHIVINDGPRDKKICRHSLK